MQHYNYPIGRVWFVLFCRIKLRTAGIHMDDNMQIALPSGLSQTESEFIFQPDEEEHLTLIFVWKEEETKNGRVGDFVIGSLAMQLQERGKNLDGVSTSVELRFRFCKVFYLIKWFLHMNLLYFYY